MADNILYLSEPFNNVSANIREERLIIRQEGGNHNDVIYLSIENAKKLSDFITKTLLNYAD